ncbi:hypothetical protein [Bacillus piscicola]|uniref:hypothetical protein n=1 Tax=Bacillus piscicola TaxID=1632684 RepID=UPI001F09027F|nr:hypothetical protein [Bacillus piscicola]
MPKKNVSRCSIPVKRHEKKAFVKITNNNANEEKRILSIAAYDKNDEDQKHIPIFVDQKRAETITLKPAEAKVCEIDVTNVAKKVVFECTQTGGGSGLSVSSRSSGPIHSEIGIK